MPKHWWLATQGSAYFAAPANIERPVFRAEAGGGLTSINFGTCRMRLEAEATGRRHEHIGTESFPLDRLQCSAASISSR